MSEPWQHLRCLDLNYLRPIVLIGDEVENDEHKALESEFSAVTNNIHHLRDCGLVVPNHHPSCDPIEQVEGVIVGEFPYSFVVLLLVVLGKSVHQDVLLFFEFGKLAVEVSAREH